MANIDSKTFPPDFKPFTIPGVHHILTGQQYGYWFVIGFAGPAGRNVPFWLCRCACGKLRCVVQQLLTSGRSKSCGCQRYKLASHSLTTHGLTNTPHYFIYKGIIARCYDPSVRGYKFYGAKGITVCDRWRFGEDDLSGLECFYQDLGERPTPTHSIDRKNNRGNYEPDNCHWATRREQALNRSDNHLVTFQNQTLSVTEWGEILPISRATIYQRLAAHWPVEIALTWPLNKHYRPHKIPYTS